MRRDGASHAHGGARRVKTPPADGPARPLGIEVGPERRLVDEAAIIDLLLAQGWPAAMTRRDRASAVERARQVLDGFVRQGLGFRRSTSGERRFDPGEVTNFPQWLSRERGDRFWSENCVQTARRFTWLAHGLEPREGAIPPPPTALGPRRFTVRLNRRFGLEGRAAGTSLRLRLPLPVEDHALGDLKVTVLAPVDAEAEFTMAKARLDARVVIPAAATVELGFEASFTAHPGSAARSPAPLDPEDAALYTRRDEGIVRVTDEITRLAAEVAGGAVDAWAQLERFWIFTLERLKFGVVNYEDVEAARPQEWTLRNGWTDCRLASALIVALCRARGIPARLVTGYVLDEDAPYYHCWCEAWIAGRGWAPLDTESWFYAGGGREPLWRDYYLGQLDHRMKTEVLPRLFNGPGSLRFPAAWIRLSKIEDQGMTQSFHDSKTGALIYRDHVAIVEATLPSQYSA